MNTTTQLFLKKIYKTATALFVGCALWYGIARQLTFPYTLYVPLTVAFNKAHHTLTYPATIPVTVSLSRTHLLALQNSTNTGAYINGEHLQHGLNTIPVDASQIVLPDGVKVVHCNPVEITVYNVHSSAIERTKL